MLESLGSGMGKMMVAFHYESLLNLKKNNNHGLHWLKWERPGSHPLTVNFMVTRTTWEDGKLFWFHETRCWEGPSSSLAFGKKRGLWELPGEQGFESLCPLLVTGLFLHCLSHPPPHLHQVPWHFNRLILKLSSILETLGRLLKSWCFKRMRR